MDRDTNYHTASTTALSHLSGKSADWDTNYHFNDWLRAVVGVVFYKLFTYDTWFYQIIFFNAHSEQHWIWLPMENNTGVDDKWASFFAVLLSFSHSHTNLISIGSERGNGDEEQGPFFIDGYKLWICRISHPFQTESGKTGNVTINLSECKYATNRGLLRLDKNYE